MEVEVGDSFSLFLKIYVTTIGSYLRNPHLRQFSPIIKNKKKKNKVYSNRFVSVRTEIIVGLVPFSRTISLYDCQIDSVT